VAWGSGTMAFAVSVNSSWLLVGIAALAGCGPRAQPAVRYSGETAAQPNSAALKHADVLPLGYKGMGVASSSCRFTADRRQIDNELLSDVDCGEARLRQALARHAHRVGAEVVVQGRCYQTFVPGSREVTLSCRGDLARMAEAHKALRPLGHAPHSVPDLAAGTSGEVLDQAWQIVVDYEPLVEGRLEASRPGDAVREFGHLPVSHRALGKMTASCETTCEVSTVRQALRVAAGRLGADAISDVGCHVTSSGSSCVARVAQYAAPAGDPEERAP
jgi:hypothetical protein